jgi:uncharacterized protein
MSIVKYPWGHNRRFNSYTEYFKNNFGGRVQKLTIDAGFTCPNRDGTLGTGGCTFCNNNAFNPSYCQPEKSISRQITEGIEFHQVRYRRVKKYLAYFQAYSNTYASVTQLKELYDEALSFPEIIGLVIGTRPDCVDNDILDYLQDLSRKTYLIVEYGIESCYDQTLRRINRGHTFATTAKAIKDTAKRGIRTGGHVIIGLPGESEEDILHEAEILSTLPLNTIKFHQLQIVKDTSMATEYLKNPELFSDYQPEEYIELIINLIERINPEFVIERIAGETSPAYNLRPSWKLRYDQILAQFEKRLEERDSWQGKYYNANSL